MLMSSPNTTVEKRKQCKYIFFQKKKIITESAGVLSLHQVNTYYSCRISYKIQNSSKHASFIPTLTLLTQGLTGPHLDMAWSSSDLMSKVSPNRNHCIICIQIYLLKSVYGHGPSLPTGGGKFILLSISCKALSHLNSTFISLNLHPTSFLKGLIREGLRFFKITSILFVIL